MTTVKDLEKKVDVLEEKAGRYAAHMMLTGVSIQNTELLLKAIAENVYNTKLDVVDLKANLAEVRQELARQGRELSEVRQELAAQGKELVEVKGALAQVLEIVTRLDARPQCV